MKGFTILVKVKICNMVKIWQGALGGTSLIMQQIAKSIAYMRQMRYYCNFISKAIFMTHKY